MKKGGEGGACELVIPTLHSAGPPTRPPNVDAGSHNPISDGEEAGNEMVVVQSDDIIIKHNSTEHLTTGVH